MLFLHRIDILKDYISNSIFNIPINLDILNYKTTNFNDYRYLQQAVESFFIEQNYNKAESLFTKLIKLYPSLNTFYKYKAICMYFNKDYNNAIYIFEKSKTIVFQDNELHYYLGLCYFRKQKYFQASKHFKFAIDFSSDKKLSYYIKLAISLRELKDYKQALEVLNKSLKFNTKNYGTYYQLYKIHTLLDNKSLAEKNIKIADALKF